MSRDEDGSYYVVLFILSAEMRCVRFEFEELGIGKANVRDLWMRQTILAEVATLQMQIPACGAKLSRL